MTASTAISQLLNLLDEAFDGRDWHSLVGNLRPVTNEDWLWVPQGGQRSIRDIVRHVGGSKFMYHDYAFGAATLAWDDPLVNGDETLESIESAIAWLRAGQERLRHSIAALMDDTELTRLRMTNWGERKETGWIIMIVTQHDLYHAGEINHLRSLRQSTDRWAYDTGDE
ncbi:MAG TPA: DinB family protein [Ktedonobacterales bacterium]|jgi:uncharacterized damage-inducible protein DinB